MILPINGLTSKRINLNAYDAGMNTCYDDKAGNYKNERWWLAQQQLSKKEFRTEKKTVLKPGK